MPKKTKQLSALEVSRLRDVGFYAVGGVWGLHLQVRGGSRSWILRATIGNKRRDIGLGGFPDITLADARNKAREFRAKIAEGIDPIAERRAAMEALNFSPLTFDQVAERLITAKEPEWSNRKHAEQWRSTLRTYASPIIGKMRVDHIELRHVLAVLEPIWTEKTETASRLRARMEAVMAWATASGYRDGDNPARWKGNLDALLAKPGKVKKVRHHRAVPIDDMPQFMVALRKRQGTAARALELLILTATRSGEVRGATWDEFDLDAATWTIPAERMKMGKEHRAALSDDAVNLLRALPHTSELVFPGMRGSRPLSDMTLSAVMRRMDVDATPHGFRSTFRDWCAERTNFPHELAEMALAHAVGNKVEAAYRRGDMLAKRDKMMNAWAQFIGTTASASVTPITGAKNRA